jgi:hypothetical protein
MATKPPWKKKRPAKKAKKLTPGKKKKAKARARAAGRTYPNLVDNMWATGKKKKKKKAKAKRTAR